MTNETNDENFIPLLTLGEMRLLNINVPEHLADNPDDRVLTLPRSAALRLTQTMLDKWRVPQNEKTDFLEDISDVVISDVLVIHQLLRVLFPRYEPGKYIQTSNKNYDGRTTWQAIRDGESLKVRKYLEYMVFSGGW
jgi:hypothetical protein